MKRELLILGLVILILWLLAGCAGTAYRPLGVDTFSVEVSPDGSCHVQFGNGKENAGVVLRDVTICGGRIGEVRIDQATGATAVLAQSVSNTGQVVGVLEKLVDKVPPMLAPIP